MNKEDWKIVEDKLKDIYNPVKLLCDGYELALVLIRYNQYKNVITVYVNGIFKGQWLAEDCEERRRFLKSSVRSLLSNKDKAAFKKLSRKRQEELGINRTYTTYSPYWTSFRSLKSHLVKNNKAIELVKAE